MPSTHSGPPISPAIQMRERLAVAREAGEDFDEAWAEAIGEVRWPHDTWHRKEWKAVLRSAESKAMWRSAYYREPVSKHENAALLLVA